jgi:arogenate dehydrogenase (NADP+)
MMAHYNKGSLLRSLVSYRHSLDQLIELLEQEDWQALEKKLQQTQLQRSQFISAVDP